MNTCLKCKGSGFIEVNGFKQKCICILKNELQNYLTSIYIDAKFIKNFDEKALDNKNIVMHGKDISSFKAVVKTYLVNKTMKLKHLTLTVNDVLMSYLDINAPNNFYDILSVDFLIILFISDPRNKSYGETLESIISRRNLNKKITWIYSKNKIESNVFKEIYTKELAEFVNKNFISIEV